MYETFFQFGARPFVAAPLATRYFPAQSVEAARQTLTGIIERAAGPGLLVGAAGLGKSLLCHVLAEQFRGKHRVAMLGGSRLCTRKALLQSILFELGLPYREPDEGNLRLTLMDHLQPSDDVPHGLLLIVDEAHTLPYRLMDELRMIGNVVRDGKPRVQILLAGGPLLDERFTNPKLESFNQRLAARCYLQPLTYGETFEYVRQQIFAVGGTPDRIFTEDALRTIFQATDGIPRLINQLGDHALMLAAAGGRSPIDAAGIQEAWADLQQIPAPFREIELERPTETSSSGIIEFGQLEDEFVGPSSSYTLPSFDQFETTTPTFNAVAQFDDESLAEIQLRIAERDREATEWTEQQQPLQARSVLANGTEVELVFHGPHKPFEESWDEEEIVIDRYASMEKQTVPPKPHIISIEPAREAKALAMAAKSTHEFSAREVHDEPAREVRHDAPQIISISDESRVEPAPQPIAAEVAAQLAVREVDSLTVRIEDIAARHYEPLVPQIETVDYLGDGPLPEPVSVLVSPTEEIAEPILSERESMEGVLRMTRPDDRDLIVVNDGSDDDEGETPAPKIEPIAIKEVRVAGRAKRQEYRQLFATLRNR